jgi:hypothetical protein
MFEYNPEHIIVSWAEIIFSGFGTDSRVTGARLQDGVKLTAGNDGVITATINPDLSGMITVNLIQGSETAALLLAIQGTQERTGRLQKKPFSITDLAGSVLINAPNAWLRKLPDHGFASEAGNRDWIFDCDKLLFKPGQSLF